MADSQASLALHWVLCLPVPQEYPLLLVVQLGLYHQALQSGLESLEGQVNQGYQ